MAQIDESQIIIHLEDAVKDYEVVLDIYAQNSPERKQYCVYPKKDGREYPVWYEDVGQTVYLSPACMSRSVFHNRVQDLVGSNRSCSSQDELCPACRLFGMIGKTSSVGSRVRFGDAAAEGTPETVMETLRELASPKTSSVEFYTKRPENAKMWTYDYLFDGNRKKPVCVQLRGRKFYLHSKSKYYKAVPDSRGNLKTLRNSTMELMPPGTVFHFTVYFDRVTEEDLARLLWVLTLGNNAADHQRLHKIGHGKPIGLGSVRIQVEKMLVRHFRNHGYEICDADADALIASAKFERNSIYFQELTAITRMNDASGTVSYPIAEDRTGHSANSSASHQWFLANRGTVNNPEIKYTLPSVMERGGVSLPAMYREESYNSGNGRGTYSQNKPGGFPYPNKGGNRRK